MSEQGPLAGPGPASGPYINHHMSSCFINVYSLSHCPCRLSGSKINFDILRHKHAITVPRGQAVTGPANSLHTVCDVRALRSETSQAVAENILARPQMMCSVQSEECLQLSGCLQVVGLKEALFFGMQPI